MAEEFNSCLTPYLIGETGVLVVLIEDCEKALTNQQREMFHQQFKEAIGLLTEAEPKASLRFAAEHHSVVLKRPDLTTSSGFDEEDYERFEAAWRDAALAQLGYPDLRSLLCAFLSRKGLERGFVILATTWPCAYFAYSDDERATLVLGLGDPVLHMEDVSGVLVHETCHLFGAQDEYGDCDCGSLYGYLGIKNTNCISCIGEDLQQPCIMAGTSYALCESTRLQLGWREDLIKAVLQGQSL